MAKLGSEKRPAVVRVQTEARAKEILEICIEHDDRVSQNRERFLVTKKGEAKAVILGVEDFLQAVVKIPKSLAALQEQARKSGADKLTLEEIEADASEIPP